MKIFDDSIAVGKRGFNRATENDGGWTDGEVGTPWGFVSVYAQGNSRGDNFSRLDFIWSGRLYMRNFPGTRFSKRGLKTKALQFAQEIASQSAPQGGE